MNKILAIVLVFLFFSISPGLAKPKPQPQKPITADDMVAKMKMQLQLTDQQAEDVKPIIQKYLEEEKAIKNEEKRALRKVLTGQQMFTWNFLQNERSQQKKKK